MASLEELLYFLFLSQHPRLQTLYEMMKIEEKQSFGPTCALSFSTDFSLQGSRCNQLSSSGFLCCPGAKCHCSCCWWDTHLCSRYLPLSAKGNLSWQSCLKCVELEAVPGIICIQLIGPAHVWFVCISVLCVFVARPAWPLQDHSFLPLCLHRVFFALFVGLWCISLKLHVPC